jgi:hypothetical protein
MALDYGQQIARHADQLSEQAGQAGDLPLELRTF